MPYNGGNNDGQLKPLVTKPKDYGTNGSSISDNSCCCEEGVSVTVSDYLSSSDDEGELNHKAVVEIYECKSNVKNISNQ